MTKMNVTDLTREQIDLLDQVHSKVAANPPLASLTALITLGLIEGEHITPLAEHLLMDYATLSLIVYFTEKGLVEKYSYILSRESIQRLEAEGLLQERSPHEYAVSDEAQAFVDSIHKRELNQ